VTVRAPSHVALLALAAAILVAAGAARAADAAPAAPKQGDKCPVCGMFVARYPDWVASARFADGSYAVFDGAKDLFRFWLEPGRHLPRRTREVVVALFVTDYYGVKPVNARAAWYVVGSDVLGPMGHELVPFATEDGAREFARDHHGKRVLRFDDVTAELLKGLG
jgi:nitrous oxide reductase accessory protein NosL